MPISTPHHNQDVIKIQNVSFSYPGNQVIQDVSLTIHQGDYLGLIGPNGGGKSTLLKLILGLLKPDSGTIQITGSIGYVPQNPSHIDFKFPATVWDVVSMGRFAKAGLFHPLSSKDRTAVATALSEVDMTEFKNRLIGNLSGGQQQRVFIARALVSDPETIFLDEPTSGVDNASTEIFYKLLKKLNTQLNITLVLVSHDIDIVTKEVTEIAAINQKLIFYGSSHEFVKEEHLQKVYVPGVKFIEHHHHHA